MKQNVKVAKQLVKLAKNLIAAHYDDDIDMMGLYFPTCTEVCGKIVEEFLKTIK